jgi:fatty acid/phospholipid biosynthesis enzyme
VVVCHGASTRRAIANAIALADRAVTEDVVGRTGAALEAAGAVRAASVAADTLGAR